MAKKFFVTVMHRGRAWVEYLVRWRITTCLIAIAVAVYGVVLRVAGLGRSLWLDEAWVANSVASPTLAKMFYYNLGCRPHPPVLAARKRYCRRLWTHKLGSEINTVADGSISYGGHVHSCEASFIATVCAFSNRTIRALSSCDYVFEDTEAVQLRACG